MRKIYLLVYSDSLGSREAIKKCLSSLESVVTWRYDMPNSFYIISEESANVISHQIREYLGFNKGRFLVTEIPENRQGWLPKPTWYFIKNKLHSKE